MATRRKRAEKKADEAPADGALVDHENEKEEPPPSPSVETVDGLLSLRGHLETRVPGGLLWPLQKLPSMDQHLSDLESAGEAVDRLAVRHAMSNEKLRELRMFLLSDAYAMTYLVCRHRDIVPEVHMAMCYAAAWQAQKLAWLITRSGFEGFVIEQFREACRIREIDPSTHDGVMKLDHALDWQNHRWSRGWYKSSGISHAATVIAATIDPNETILICTAKEDKADQLVTQCGKTMTSGIYADLFPDRVPATARDISKSEGILVKGRSVSSRERTIQGTSYITREISGHYSIIITDDIVIRDVRGGIIGGGEGGPAIRWLHGMRGLRINSRRHRRIHCGTINSLSDDDHAWLTKGSRKQRVFTVVVPAEAYAEGHPASVYTRGTPTAPDFFGADAIREALDDCIADETEADGIEAFRSDFWLAPSPNATQMFTEEMAYDPDHAWLGPFKHPQRDPVITNGQPQGERRFLVARFVRDDAGKPKGRDGRVLDEKVDGWRASAAVVSYDPWSDLDRILTVNPTWADGARLWGATASGVDSDGVRYQLETRSGNDGVFGWILALDEMARIYLPRRIGLETKALNDEVIRNAMRIDQRLRAHRGRIIGVDLQSSTRQSRIRAAFAEPLATYQWMLLPMKVDGDSGEAGDFGAAATRRELLKYRSGVDTPWPILDSLAMTGALLERVQTREERAEARRAQMDNEARYRQSVGVLGVPSAA